MGEINYNLMFALLRAGAHERHVKLSTREIAGMLGVSQQTASRWLIEFQKDGLAERDISGIRLTHLANSELKTLSELLLSSLEAKKKLRLSGIVLSGMKEGRYYVNLPEYRRQFKEKLGFLPYPGTLNLRARDMEAKLILAERKGTLIRGFSYQGRILGDIKCFPCFIGKREKGFVILPSRSHYGLDVFELISKVNLRKKLNLKDGDEVECVVSLE